MRGLTPVVAIILLLLMAVAAVGGAYLWYGRFQSGTQERVSSEMSERVEGQMGTAISIFAVYATRESANGTANSTNTPLNENVVDDFNYWCSRSWLESEYNNNTLLWSGTEDCNETSPAHAKLVLLVKNSGSEVIRASEIPAGNDIGEIKVLVDGRPVKIHIDNGTMSTYNLTQAEFAPKSLRPGEDRRIDIDFSCYEIGRTVDKVIEINVVPKRGASDTYELSCEQCCRSLREGAAQCERESCG